MRRYLWFLAILALLGTALAFRRVALGPPGNRPVVLILAPQAEWAGVSPSQREGFGALFKDALEYAGGLAVVEEAQAIQAKGEALEVLQVGVSRSGDQIRIQLLRRRAGRGQESLATGLEPPRKAMASALERLGLEPGSASLVAPRAPETFWKLAEVADWRLEQGLAEALAACGQIVEREPECASAWLAQARVYHMQLLTDPGPDPDAQAQCEAGFLRALDLAPDYPRALTGFARFLTDVGNQRGALDLLFPAIARLPRTPRTYEAVAYAARTAGLVQGAVKALRQRDRVLGLSRGEAGLTENTYLYLGDLVTFETVLGAGSEQEPDSIRDFYRGYARLLQGDRLEALRFFQRARLHPSGVPQFEALAHIYELGLSGEATAALARLRALWAGRVAMRVPDGEYTFKLAEAFGFLDSPGEAQEVATRAFAQGFGCTGWYQRSPFLAAIRRTPRWNALQQHLQERQALIERTYPADRFRF